MSNINRKDIKYKDWTESDLEIKLTFLNRIRVLFGARLKVTTWVGTPWVTTIGVLHEVNVEKIIKRRAAKLMDTAVPTQDVPERAGA